MTQLSTGSIVSLSHDGRQRLARRGDMVYFWWRRKWRTALVVRWSGDLDSPARLLDSLGEPYTRFISEKLYLTGEPEASGEIIVTCDQGERERRRIEDLLATKRGRDILARMDPADMLDPYIKGATSNDGPSASNGAPVISQPPLVMTRRGSSRLSGRMERLICGSPKEYARARLKQEYPHYFEVWRLHKELGVPHKQIAYELGITYRTARWRSQQAMWKRKEYFESWRAIDRAERLAESVA